MTAFLLVVHLMIAVALIGSVLLQRSEGGALGMGGGGGGFMSGRGAANVLTRTTAYLALGFFATSILLTIVAANRGGTGSVITDEAPVSAPITAPLPETKAPPVPETTAPPEPAGPAVPRDD